MLDRNSNGFAASKATLTEQEGVVVAGHVVEEVAQRGRVRASGPRRPPAAPVRRIIQ